MVEFCSHTIANLTGQVGETSLSKRTDQKHSSSGGGGGCIAYVFCIFFIIINNCPLVVKYL